MNIKTRVFDIILIRHGQSESNAGTSSDPDSPLTDWGRAHSETPARLLSGMNLDGFVCYTSPFKRCVQTAAIIQAQTDLAINVDDRLVTMRRLPRFEVSNGIREWGPRAVANGEHFEHESVDAFITRIESWFAEHCQQNMIIVSHASPIAVLTSLAMNQRFSGKGEFWRSVSNCNLRWLRYIR